MEADVEVGGVEALRAAAGEVGPGLCADSRASAAAAGAGAGPQASGVAGRSSVGIATGRAAPSGVAVVAEVTQAPVIAPHLMVHGGAVLPGFGLALGSISEILQFHEEVLGAEDVAQHLEYVESFGLAPGIDEPAHFSLAATGEADDPFVVFAQLRRGEGGRTVALGDGQVRGGDQAAEVGVAFARLGQEHQVVGVLDTGEGRSGGRARGGAAHEAAARAAAACRPEDVRRSVHTASPRRPPLASSWRFPRQRLHAHLGSEDGLQTASYAGLGKTNGAVEAVMVGKGQGRLPQLHRSIDQLGDAAASVEEAEVGVHVQVHERGRDPIILGRRQMVTGRCARSRRDVLGRGDGAGGRRPRPGIGRSAGPAVLWARAVATDVVVTGRDALDWKTVQPGVAHDPSPRLSYDRLRSGSKV